MKLAYIIYEVQEKYNNNTSTDEDQDLLLYLKAKGLDIHSEIWNDPKVDWNQYQAVIIKSPWDYHEKITDFSEWLKSLNVPVYNDVNTLLWNADKHYLNDIAQAGLPVIPTQYVEKGSDIESIRLAEGKYVIKPCISAGSKNTLCVEAKDLNTISINEWLEEEAYMIQPYIEEIQNGEWSLLYFGGVYSHSLRKTPKENDFRVQHYLGGQIHYESASNELIEQANAYVQKFAANTLYARVDGVILNGVFHLMELELIEPYLFLNNDTQRFENYFKALQDKICRI